MASALPSTVRYIKIGESGRWWRASKERNQIHVGWKHVPHALLAARDLPAIERCIRDCYGTRRGATQDYRGLVSLIDRPSRHIWITFEAGSLWWCTAKDELAVNSEGADGLGHFWLVCDRPWSDRSVDERSLEMSNLPGTITATAGFRATTCEPAAAAQILRLLRGERDPEVARAEQARIDYEQAVGALIGRLNPKDFELLIDLVLARSGWVRVAKLAGATEGIDIEAENVAIGETAFVQVKSAAGQDELDDYVQRFADRRERYARMIFAVHEIRGALRPPADPAVQLWDRKKIAGLVVKLGLGEWVASRV